MDKGFHKILCPIDFSEPSSNALKKAAGLISLFNAELVIAHIISNPFSKIYASESYFTEPVTEIVKTVGKMITKFVEEHLSDVSFTLRVRNHEHVYGGIIECVEEDDVDLIVMSTRGVTGPKRVLLGSVAESVVRRAPCSVLVVRP